MKGQLPIKTLVIMGIVVLVLVALAAFVMPTAFRQTTIAEAQSIFSQKCVQYRTPDVEENYLNAYTARSDTEFLEACEILGFGSAEYPNRCLEKCPINLEVTEEDLERNYGDLVNNVLEGP